MNTESLTVKPTLLGKYWRWCVLLGLVMASVTFLLHYLREAEYECTHLLEWNHDNLLIDDESSKSSSVGSTQAIQEAKVFIFQNGVLDAVLADPAFAVSSSLANPLAAERELRSRLRVDSGGTDRYLAISYRDRNAVMAANICNAVTESFVRAREMTNDKKNDELIRWLTPTIAQWRAKVQNQREDIIEIDKATGTQTDMIAKAGTSIFSGETSEMFFAKQDFKQSCEVLEKLNRRMATLRIESCGVPSLQSVSKAKPATCAVEPRDPLKSAMFALLAFCVPSVSVFLVGAARRE